MERDVTKKAFEKIAEGLNEVLAIARGEFKPARFYVPGYPHASESAALMSDWEALGDDMRAGIKKVGRRRPVPRTPSD